MTIKVESDTTGEIFEILPGELHWDHAGEEDRGMGAETYWEATVVRTASDGSTVTVTVDASEYPIGAGREINDVTVEGGKEVE